MACCIRIYVEVNDRKGNTVVFSEDTRPTSFIFSMGDVYVAVVQESGLKGVSDFVCRLPPMAIAGLVIRVIEADNNGYHVLVLTSFLS